MSGSTGAQCASQQLLISNGDHHSTRTNQAPGWGERIKSGVGFKVAIWIRYRHTSSVRSAEQSGLTNGPSRRRTQLCKPHSLGWAGITHPSRLSSRRLGRDTARTIVKERRENGDLLREHINAGAWGVLKATWDCRGGEEGGGGTRGKQEIEGGNMKEERGNGGGIRWKLRLYSEGGVEKKNEEKENRRSQKSR